MDLTSGIVVSVLYAFCWLAADWRKRARQRKANREMIRTLREWGQR
jgi:hypothetical protein